jgi:hypothetical protein
MILILIDPSIMGIIILYIVIMDIFMESISVESKIQMI